MKKIVLVLALLAGGCTSVADCHVQWQTYRPVEDGSTLAPASAPQLVHMFPLGVAHAADCEQRGGDHQCGLE